MNNPYTVLAAASLMIGLMIFVYLGFAKPSRPSHYRNFRLRYMPPEKGLTIVEEIADYHDAAFGEVRTVVVGYVYFKDGKAIHHYERKLS